MSVSEDSFLSPITQTFISHIVLDLLKPLCPNEEFVRIKNLDFHTLINLDLFKNLIAELQLLDLDPNNPLVSAVRLARQHFYSDNNFLEELVPTVPNVLDLVPILEDFFQQHIPTDLPDHNELTQCLQELGFLYLKHIQNVTVTVTYG
jgi:hypothetical protein